MCQASVVRRRRYLSSCAIAAAFFIAAAFVQSVSAAPSPSARYRALLAKPFPVAGLPSGYTSPRVSRATPSDGAVGAVDVRFAGGGKGLVVYTIFRSHADATAAWDEWVATGESEARFGTRVAPGLARPNYLLSGVSRGTQNTLANVTGTVLTVTTNSVLRSAPSHNQAATVALARAANTHLLAIG